MKNKLIRFLGAMVTASFLVLGLSSTASAGPVIVGGDDLQDHGNYNPTTMLNEEGWKYIELAIKDLFANQTRAADTGMPTTVDIAALGSSLEMPNISGNGGGGAAIWSAVNNAVGGSIGTLSFHNGATDINQFFTDLGNGTINPAVIWLAGDGVSNSQDSTEDTALAANAAAINTYVANGGGLMSHGTNANSLGWLTTLLPGISVNSGCQSGGAMLTAAGIAAFPGLSNSDVDSNAGPCHANFTGNFGGLVSLVNDGQGRPYIIGGGGGTVIQCGLPGQPPCTQVPVPATLPLLGLGLIGLAAIRRRKSV